MLEKKWIKIQNTKKNDKTNTISVQFWREKKNSEVVVDLKNLSQLIGASFWCNYRAKFELRHSSFCGLNFTFKFEISNSA